MLERKVYVILTYSQKGLCCLGKLVWFPWSAVHINLLCHPSLPTEVLGGGCSWTWLFQSLRAKTSSKCSYFIIFVPVQFLFSPCCYGLWRGKRNISIAIYFGFYLTSFLRTLHKIHSLLHSQNCKGLSSVPSLEYSSEERYECCGITVRAFIQVDYCQLFAPLSTCLLSSLVGVTLHCLLELRAFFGSVLKYFSFVSSEHTRYFYFM